MKMNFGVIMPESEKPMSHGGIATWKVFARPESFCAYLWNPPLKDMPKCTDFQVVCKVSGWSGKFPDGLESFQISWKLLQKHDDVYVAKTIYALFWCICCDNDLRTSSGKYLHMKSTIKRHAQMYRFPDGLESFRMVWKVSRWTGKFTDGLENFRMVWKVFGWSGKFPDGLESFWIVWKVSG